MRIRRALYPVGPTLQRHRLADLLGGHHDLVAEIAELTGRGILVQRAVTDEVLAAGVDEVAERRRAITVGALEVPGRAALAVERHVQDLLIAEPLHVRVAI